jgi:Flp pilus assembly protein TadG
MTVRQRDERGGSSMELVLMTPAVLVLLLFVVAGGRLVLAREHVDAAARDAARAGTIARSAVSAEAEATRVADARLADAGVTCRTLHVNVDLTDYRPGGTVTTTIDCTVDLSDLTLLGVPGTRTITATAVETVDTFRGVTP